MTLFSCSKTKSIVLKRDNAEGIRKETKLIFKGLEIGADENITFDENSAVLLTANLNSEIKIPIDSQFEI